MSVHQPKPHGAAGEEAPVLESNPFPSIAPVRVPSSVPRVRRLITDGTARTYLLIGALFGAVTATAVTIAVMRSSHRVGVAPRPPAPFVVEPGVGVKLTSGGYQPMRFDAKPAELSAPLARPPVTARVATLESYTSPSFAPLEGRVVESAVRIGSHVKAGDRLVLVRTGDLAELKRSKQAAELSISTKQALLTRVEKLIESRAASQNDLLLAQSELNESKLAARAAGAKINALGIREEGETGYWVLANRPGTVVQLDAAPGKEVGPDKDKPVATVADLAEVLVMADLPQRDMGGLVVGMPVAIRMTGGQLDAITGTLETISAVLDPERQTVPVRILAKNDDGKLRPHTFVEATFLPKEGTKLVTVPTEAVISDGSISVVFVEEEPGAFRRRVVQVGRQTKERTELLSGVKDGEKVVVRGALLLLNAVR